MTKRAFHGGSTAMTVRRVKARGAGPDYWIVDIDYEDPNGKRVRIRKKSPVQTRRGAEHYERDVRQSLLMGTYKVPVETKPIPTLEEFVDEFLDVYAKSNNEANEVETKRRAFRLHFCPMFGRLRLNEIGVREIEKYKSAKLSAGRSPKSINNDLTILRCALTTAKKWGLIDSIVEVQWLKAPKPEFDFLAVDESERLLAGAQNEPMFFAMMYVALRTGLRLGELLGLRWQDVDFKNGQLLVRQAAKDGGGLGPPKNGKHRDVPLTSEALAVLRKHRHLRGEFVFCQEDGSRLTKNACARPLKRALRRAGLRNIGWHALRHTFASQLVMKGQPIIVVKELLGHSTIEMTMRYAHLAPHMHADAVKVLDPSGSMTAAGTLP